MSLLGTCVTISNIYLKTKKSNIFTVRILSEKQNNEILENERSSSKEFSVEDINRLLRIFSNTNSRKIIESLAFEPTYLYRLSKKVGLNHSTVLKQLNNLKELGIIEECEPFTSDSPKERQYYQLSKHINMKIRFGHGFYDFETRAYKIGTETEPLDEEMRESFQSILKDLKSVEEDLNKVSSKKLPGNSFLKKLEKLLNKFDDVEAYLLLERQLFLVRILKGIAFNKLTGDESIEARSIFYEVLKHPDRKASKTWLMKQLDIDPESFSDSLDRLINVKLLKQTTEEEEEYFKVTLKKEVL